MANFLLPVKEGTAAPLPPLCFPVGHCNTDKKKQHKVTCRGFASVIWASVWFAIQEEILFLILIKLWQPVNAIPWRTRPKSLRSVWDIRMQHYHYFYFQDYWHCGPCILHIWSASPRGWGRSPPTCFMLHVKWSHYRTFTSLLPGRRVGWGMQGYLRLMTRLQYLLVLCSKPDQLIWCFWRKRFKEVSELFFRLLIAPECIERYPANHPYPVDLDFQDVLSIISYFLSENTLWLGPYRGVQLLHGDPTVDLSAFKFAGYYTMLSTAVLSSF